MYEFACVIGRFQPFHNGHSALLRAALKKAKRVVVLVGSVSDKRTLKNPFTFHERAEMILGALPKHKERILPTPLADVVRDDITWQQRAKEAYYAVARQYSQHIWPHPLLVGHAKDASSFYLRRFGEWDKYDPGSKYKLSATTFRNAYFNAGKADDSGNSLQVFFIGAENYLPLSTIVTLEDFCSTPAYRKLAREYRKSHPQD